MIIYMYTDYCFFSSSFQLSFFFCSFFQFIFCFLTHIHRGGRFGVQHNYCNTIIATQSLEHNYWNTMIGTQFHPEAESASALDGKIFEEFIIGITGEVPEMRMVA